VTGRGDTGAEGGEQRASEASLGESARGAGLESAAVGAALLTGFGIAAVLLALGAEFRWIGFPMIGGLVPLSVGLARWYGSSRATSGEETADETEDALERLRERYARGDLTEAEFERRLEPDRDRVRRRRAANRRATSGRRRRLRRRRSRPGPDDRTRDGPRAGVRPSPAGDAERICLRRRSVRA